MNFKNLLLTLISSLALVNAYTGNCNSIYNYLSKKGYAADLKECVTNTRGKVTKLNLYTYCLSIQDVNKIINFRTITDLTFSTAINESDDSDNPVTSLMNCREVRTIPSAISELRNLRNLDLTGISNLRKGDITKIPRSIRSLIIGKSTLNQNIVNEFRHLRNLSNLEFKLTKFANGVRFNSASDLQHLRTLKISTGIEDVDQPVQINNNFLRYFSSLTSLYINQGKFNQNVLDEIGRLTRLKELSITSSDFAPRSNIQSFKKLRNLELLTIDAKNSHMATISSSLYYLTRLKSLTITNHGATSFPTTSSLSFLKLKNLEYLDLSTNEANINLNQITGLTRLKNLNLNKNKITAIPRSIGNLSNLTTLFVNNNEITTLTSGIGDLRRLVNLDISYNEIETLPKSIGNLKKLEYLQFSNNQISRLPDTIGNLENLTFIEFANNPINGELPASLNNLKNLKYFNF